RREVEPPARLPARSRSGPPRRGAGGAVAGTEGVGRDDEVARGIERAAGAEQPPPPAVDVRRAGERVADDHRVVARHGELPPGAVGDLDAGQPLAAVELERPVEGEDAGLRRDVRVRVHDATPTPAPA